MTALLVSWHDQCIALAASHIVEVSAAYDACCRDALAFSERLERQSRLAIIDDAIRDVRRHFAGAVGVDGASSSSASTWGTAEHIAAAKSSRQRRVKQLEDTNQLLQRQYDSVRLERDHLASSLFSLERRAADGVRAVTEATKLRAENAKLQAAVHKLTSTRSAVRHQISQTGDHFELEVVTLRRQNKLICIYNLDLQEQLQRQELWFDFVVGAQRLYDGFLQIRHQDRNAMLKRLHKGTATATLENQMLHEELSLCLRRIAKLEADQGVQIISDDPATRTAKRIDDANTQTNETSAWTEQLLGDVESLEVDNSKLKMLLTKFVGLVASETSK